MPLRAVCASNVALLTHIQGFQQNLLVARRFDVDFLGEPRGVRSTREQWTMCHRVQCARRLALRSRGSVGAASRAVQD
jgi:hypothetical protein